MSGRLAFTAPEMRNCLVTFGWSFVATITLCNERGLAEESLGFEADLDRTYISSVERGKRNISLLNIHRLARALRVNPRDLV